MANQQGIKNNNSTGNNQHTDKDRSSQVGTGIGRDQRHGQTGQGQSRSNQQSSDTQKGSKESR